MMIKYTKKEVEAVLREEFKKYEAAIGTMTPEERKELHEWAAARNSAYDNPCLLWDDDGHPFDFITALRIDEDMRSNPEDYHFGGPPHGADNDSEPF